MIYLDSAAVVKLVHAEAESAALRNWLDERAETGLDAIHLGTALHARQALTSFVTYDKRLLDAALAAGLAADAPASPPGASEAGRYLPLNHTGLSDAAFPLCLPAAAGGLNMRAW
jgi:predicted nucleic acid-binding protein